MGSKPAADAAKSPLPFPVPGDRVELPRRAKEGGRDREIKKEKKKSRWGRADRAGQMQTEWGKAGAH